MALFNFGKKKVAEKKADVCPCCENEGENTENNPDFNLKDSKIYSVKVLGSGCKNCHALLENTKDALRELKLPVEAEYITDMKKIAAYGVMSMPALVVNEKVASMGKVLKTADVIALLSK